MTQPMILSWCPGDKCDPCTLTYDLRIVGNTYDTPGNPVVYISYYLYPTGTKGVVTVRGELVVTSISSIRPTQKFTLLVKATGEVQYGSNALAMPLPDQSTGIITDEHTISNTMDQTGNVVIEGVLAPTLYSVEIPPG